jgi:hypothetical protein
VFTQDCPQNPPLRRRSKTAASANVTLIATSLVDAEHTTHQENHRSRPLPGGLGPPLGLLLNEAANIGPLRTIVIYSSIRGVYDVANGGF